MKPGRWIPFVGCAALCAAIGCETGVEEPPHETVGRTRQAICPGPTPAFPGCSGHCGFEVCSPVDPGSCCHCDSGCLARGDCFYGIGRTVLGSATYRF